MKKIVLSFCALTALVLMGCEKPLISEGEEESEDTEGNLTVTVWQSGHEPFPTMTRATSLDDYNRLNYAIYTSDGTRVKQVNQTRENTGFGSATFQLEPATYQLVVVAHNCDKNPAMTNLNKIQFTNAMGYTDTSLYYGEVEVTEEHKDVQVDLERIVSLCRVIITDEYPEDVTQMRFQYKGGSGAFDAKTGYGCVNSTQTLFFDVTNGQKQFDLYTYLHDEEGTLHLLATAYDDADNVIHEREFEVPMLYNQITRVSGPFFTGSGNGSLDITIVINTDWSGVQDITF